MYRDQDQFAVVSDAVEPQSVDPLPVRNSEDEGRLVQRAQTGNEKAFEALVNKYAAQLAKVIAHYIRDPSDADDVFQETLIRIYRALPRFRGDAGVYTWMYRIAVNTSKNYLALQARHARLRGGYPDADDQIERQRSSAELEPDETLIASELEISLNAIVRTMPADMRVVLTLRQVRGLTYREIADVLKVPLGTVRSRLSRAREYIFRRMHPNHSNE